LDRDWRDAHPGRPASATRPEGLPNVNEDELASLLNALEQGLSINGLSSLVNQERISAVEGKVEEVTAQDIAELRNRITRRNAGRAPGVRADDVRLRPLTVGERLAVLLDLVEAAVGGTYAIEMRLRTDLKAALDGDNGAWSGEVVFANPPESELSGVGPGEWVLPEQDASKQREAAVREVILLVNRLREQAELPRSERLHSEGPGTGTSDAPDMPGDWS
jgi:hypothetical protein